MRKSRIWDLLPSSGASHVSTSDLHLSILCPRKWSFARTCCLRKWSFAHRCTCPSLKWPGFEQAAAWYWAMTWGPLLYNTYKVTVWIKCKIKTPAVIEKLKQHEWNNHRNREQIVPLFLYSFVGPILYYSIYYIIYKIIGRKNRQFSFIIRLSWF